MAGLFITFEGPEGSGKSTQVELLRRWFGKAVVVREPGGTALGERIRDLVLHDRAMSPAAEMYLFMAARAELLAEQICPALRAGESVIADRYHDSTLAYQGGGRGLETSWPTIFPKPDRTYLLALPPEISLRRLSDADRIEREPLEFHQAVAKAYERLAAAEPKRWMVLDATASPEAIHEIVRSDLAGFLKRSQPSSS